MQVDPELQLLTAGGGCFLKDVDSVMRQYGLAITLGMYYKLLSNLKSI